MRIFGRPEEKLRRYASARKPYAAWELTAKESEWHSFAEIREVRTDADLVGDCCVFDLGGNNYRLITHIRYATSHDEGVVDVVDLLTHAEYDKGTWKKEC